MIPFGTIVYHVANSEIPGVVVGVSPDSTMARVVFKEPVGFSGNPMRGLQTDWGCSTNLLYLTAALAYENDKFKDAKKAKDVEFLSEMAKLLKKSAKKKARKSRK